MAAILTFEPDRQALVGSTGTPVSRAPAGVPVEVYRRRRLVVGALVVGLVLGALSMGRQADATRTPDAVAADSIVYVVQPGDTLWDIALELSPGRDPRPLVDALEDIAGGAMLQPGQRLVLPAHLLD